MDGIWQLIERKKADEALKSSESRFSGIIEFLLDATFAIDLDGKIISWNRAIEEMTGFSAESMLGRGDYEYAIPFYGERRPLLVNFLFQWNNEIAKKYSYINKDGDTLYTEADVPFVNGPSRTIWAKASPLRNEKGEITGAMESIRDITDKSQLLQAQKTEAVGTLAGGVGRRNLRPHSRTESCGKSDAQQRLQPGRSSAADYGPGMPRIHPEAL